MGLYRMAGDVGLIWDRFPLAGRLSVSGLPQPLLCSWEPRRSWRFSALAP